MIAGASGVMVAPPPGLKGDEGVYNYFAQVFKELGPDIPVVYQDYPQSTGVYLAPSVFERLVDDFKQLVMLKHEDWPGLAKLTRVRESEKKPGRRRVSILVGNGGLYLPQELRRGADGAMTGFAWPEMLVEVCDLFAARQDGGGARTCSTSTCRWCAMSSSSASGWRCARRCCSAAAPSRARSSARRASSLTATDRAELDNLIARLERRLAAAGRGAKVAAE